MTDSQCISAHEQHAFLAAVYESAEGGICLTEEHRRFVLVNEGNCKTNG